MKFERRRIWCALVLVCVACGSDAKGAPSGPAGAGGLGGSGLGGLGGSGLAGTGTGGQGGSGLLAAGGGAGAAGNGGAGGGDAGPSADSGMLPAQAGSADALRQLDAYLAIPRASRSALPEQPFALSPLTKQDATTAAQRIWADFAQFVREDRKSEVGATESVVRTVTANGKSLKYYLARRGSDPAGGRSLFISMHGGGNAGAATNDSQWKNQVALAAGYNPKDAIWIAPRAPIDDWNMWFVESIDALFERLITDMIVFEGINPNKVYLTGYSAGGDGVYQLGPRMAERWAGAAMSAGHPNAASPLNLRNLPFAIHVGGADTAYDRNKKAMEWGQRLEMLAAADPGGYVNQWQVHAGLPHWMELEDAVSIPFLQSHTRNPLPEKIVWEQAEVTRPHMYWLAVDASNQAKGTEVRASYGDQAVSIALAKGIRQLQVRLSDAMLDLDRPVRIDYASKQLFLDSVPRTIATIARTLEENNDPSMVFCSEVKLELP